MSLVLPKHVHDRLQAQKQAAVADSMQRTALNPLSSDDFVTTKSVRQQLDELAAYVAARRGTDAGYVLPTPSGWRLLVLMLTIPQVTDGGMHLVDDTLEARSMSSPQGVVLSVGPAAYRDRSRFAWDGALEPWVEVGDRIIWKRYDLSTFQIANGQRLGFLNDTQPVAVLDHGWDVPE